MGVKLMQITIKVDESGRIIVHVGEEVHTLVAVGVLEAAKHILLGDKRDEVEPTSEIIPDEEQ